MKRIFSTLCFVLIGLSAFAQKGEKAIGLGLSYGTEISNPGIGVFGQYNISDAFRAEASFDYFLKKDDLSMWDVNINVHYLIPIANKIKAYPLAGLSFTNWKSEFSIDYEPCDEYHQYFTDDDLEGSWSESKFGLNLGAGLQYDLNEQFAIKAEAKYQLISDFDQAVFNIGVAYKF